MATPREHLDVLVTGGSGFVGNNVTRRLLQDGHKVSLILREEGRSWRMPDVMPHVATYNGDLTDDEFVSEVVGEVKPDVVIHSAAYGAYSSEADTNKMEAVNVTGFRNLIQATGVTDARRFVNISSCFEYGESTQPHTEDGAIKPHSAYGESRLKGTQLAQAISKPDGLNAVTLRLFSTYGPYEDPRRQIAQLCLARVQGSWPEIKPPFVERDYTYIDDVVDAIILGAMSPKAATGAIYNVGTGQPDSIESLVKQVSNVLELPTPNVAGLSDSPSSRWIANSSLIRTELGWNPQTDLATGLQKTVGWIEPHADLYLPN